MNEPEQRTYDVAMSVEALASAWARTDGAPAGAVVVADREVSGRLRGGVPWTLGGADALSMAIVVRPNIAPMQEALLWTAAALAAADALTTATGTEQGVVWPDRIAASTTAESSCFVNVLVQLRPGAIDHATISIRADLVKLGIAPTEPARTALVDALSNAVKTAVELLENDSVGLLSNFSDRCLVMDQRVQAKLLPRGEARGRVTAVDHDGFLVLESSTGMLERIAPASLRSLELAPTQRP